MKILLIHADYFEYEVKEKAIKSPEELTDENRKTSIDEALVAFCAVEKEDERDITKIAEKACESIEEVAKRVKSRNIVLYPYAHLSPSLSSHNAAIQVIRKMEEGLVSKGFDVKRSPFGWYKRFSLKCKGHPLAESLRSITLEEREAVPKPEKVEGEYLVLDEEGNEHPLDLKRMEDCAILEEYSLLKQFIISEEIGRVPHEAPPHIKLMRKLELVDYEPASDIGHLRFYPKGALVKHLLEAFASDLALKELQCIRIETPTIYRMDHPDIAEQTARFLERDYRFIIDGRELTLRFAGDFGLFKMVKDMTMSYKQLPIRIYELSHSYRLEKSGECVGLRRLRSFTMPDIHCFCKDIDQAMEEFALLLDHYTKLSDSIGVDYVLAFRVIKDFYLKNKEWFVKLVKIARRPALIELLAERKHYWIVKHEYQFVDSVGGTAQLCTIQLDVEDSERYGISYVDADGKRKSCTIVHSSMGSIERWIYAMLEQAAKVKNRGGIPMLPVWLCPSQVRILPVSADQMDYAEQVFEEMIKANIRAEIDDREITLAKKVREAEIEWIPYITVVGREEEEGKLVTVRIRSEGMKKMKVDQLVEEVNRSIGDKPRLPLYIPHLLSAQAKVVA